MGRLVLATLAILLALSAAGWAAEETVDCPQCGGKGRIVKACPTCQDTPGKAACPFCRGKSSPGWWTRSERVLASQDAGDGTILCKTCGGRGIVAGAADGIIKCPACGGARRFKCPKCDKGLVVCSDCNGKSKTETDCPRCNGTGRLSIRGGPVTGEKAALDLEARRIQLKLEIINLQETVERLKKQLASVEADIARRNAAAGKKKADPDADAGADAGKKPDPEPARKPDPEAAPQTPVDKKDDF